MMSRKVMIVLLSVTAAAVAAGVIWWASARRRIRSSTGEFGQVVLRAFEGEWAKRFGCTAGELSAAFFAGADADLLDRVDREVGVADLRFDGRDLSSAVAVTITVTYASDEQRSTAHLALPWDDVPHSVRAGLLRDGDGVVFRKWRAAA